MAITITRRLARQVRAVMRRAFGNIRGHGLAMCFTAAADTLTVRAKFADVTVEYRAARRMTKCFSSSSSEEQE